LDVPDALCLGEGVGYTVPAFRRGERRVLDVDAELA
jgi:hypothetical protein